ncbi:ATP-binding cassette domain-containing protein [Paenibacillus sp. SAF-054]|uniref:ATP-binding cassette domain-containing protein n=1 Tax=unclassified Paenibacillus TaxID=185978 RepID=UPI003F805493
MLSLDHVYYGYRKGCPVIDDVSLTIREGEFVTLVGPNGSGKSTIAKLMNGLLLPTRGQVCYTAPNQGDSDDPASIQAWIGYVFQNPDDQFITTTVFDEVVFGLENIRLPREEMRGRAMSALQAVGMEAFTDARPHQLSGGQKQRVAIASIIAMRPSMIIFDEATSMLDPEGRTQMMKIMRRLHGQGMTVVHVTHHMDEVLSAERVLLLHQGKLAYDGEPLRFFEVVDAAAHKLKEPFAVRLSRQLGQNTPSTADWKEMIRSAWHTN